MVLTSSQTTAIRYALMNLLELEKEAEKEIHEMTERQIIRRRSIVAFEELLEGK